MVFLNPRGQVSELVKVQWRLISPDRPSLLPAAGFPCHVLSSSLVARMLDYLEKTNVCGFRLASPFHFDLINLGLLSLRKF